EVEQYVTDNYKTKTDTAGPLFGQISIRKESTGQLADLAAIKNGKPALVQFARDTKANTDVWNINIAAYKFVTLYDYSKDNSRGPSNEWHESSSALLPTLTWDRISGLG